jgi:hypothetical protein
MELLIFILLSYGISNIVVFGSIFNGLRDFLDRVNPSFFGTLFSCMICFPAWVGFVLSTTFQLLGYPEFSPLANYGMDNIYLSVFLDGCLASGTTWLIHTIQEKLEN